MLVAIHQPQYLPWLGYLDKIDRADVFVILDTVQFKKNEWQNRNRIRTA
nr:WbqC family protein [Nitrospirota bacterium]